MWTRENIAWAAGLFEGEGCINAANAKRSPSLAIAMTDEDVLRKFYAIIGLGSLNGPYRADRPGWKPIWMWHCGGHKQVQAVLAAMYPFLCSRRQSRALEVLAIGSTLGPNRQGAVRMGLCVNRHEMTDSNSYWWRDKRRCKECRKTAVLRHNKKKKNGDLNVQRTAHRAGQLDG